MEIKTLTSKYDVPAPRYTSYPTVPYWDTNPETEEWLLHIDKSLEKEDASICLYIHIPFCESLCSYCGCNTSVTKNHSVEDPYIKNVLQEFNLYTERIASLGKRKLKELHLGGGSPTYLSASNLDRLIGGILSKMNVSQEHSFSIEVDPRRVNYEQLSLLMRLGFNRISLGVQDFDPEVQRIINRNQSYVQTTETVQMCREIGYNSINFDLIYGLPRQTSDSMIDTISKTIDLRPDRIAFYSYAHVPWIKAAQRLFTVDDLPKGKEKRHLYEIGRELLESRGYREIGMDHFALETDSLWLAFQNNALHRNFMGYVDSHTDLLLGLGVSAISDSWTCFHQNEKILKKYQKKIEEGKFATFRGHVLNSEDRIIRKLILKLATTWEVEIPSDLYSDVQSYLSMMEEDGLIQWTDHSLKINENGRPYLRNVCMSLDMRLRRHQPNTRVFSQSI